MNQGKEKKRPFIHQLYSSPRSGADIEADSFAIIDREASSHGFPPDKWEVVRRMIHTTGDLGIAGSVEFSPGAIQAGVDAIRAGRPIYADSNMIRSGISLERLRAACPDYAPSSLVCPVAEEETARQAKDSGLPRSLFAVRRAKNTLRGGLAVFGNAPVGLLELNRMIMEENLRPALVIAMPVGFVHVLESKEELMSLDVPHIVLTGRRGGSPLAVSAVHALCTLAARKGTR
ncbi:MAG TPA: precorrin-8X methylmutase [Thermodesulfobacteriota bacterium]|nr:precorrin-8X methylmutase [Thermodesulfobacteriota bacterium]